MPGRVECGYVALPLPYVGAKFALVWGSLSIKPLPFAVYALGAGSRIGLPCLLCSDDGGVEK